MTDTAEFIITTPQNWRIISEATLHEVVGRAMESLEDVRDAKSGEQAEVTQTPIGDGVKIVVRGSESICAEARRRMSRMWHS